MALRCFLWTKRAIDPISKESRNATARPFPMKKWISVALLLLPFAACASVTSQTDKSGPFVITGLPQVIAVGFPFNQAGDLLVLDSGSAASPRDPAKVLGLGGDYTVTGGGYNGANQLQTGSITVMATGVSAVLSNDQLVIMRNVPINQTTAFGSGPNTIQQIEQALDKMATLSQQVNEVAARSLQFENFEFPGTANPVLSKALRAGNILAFDGNGNISYLPSVTAPGASGVSKLIAGSGISLSPSSGLGNVTVTAVNPNPLPNLSSTGNLLTFQSGAVAAPTPRSGVLFNLSSPAGLGSALEMDSAGDGNAFIGRRVNGTLSSPSAVLANQFLASVVSDGWDGTGYSSNDTAVVQLISTENWSSSAHGSAINFMATLNGTTSAAAVTVGMGTLTNPVSGTTELGMDCLGIFIPTSSIGILGTTTNDSPQAGCVGEQVILDVNFATPVSGGISQSSSVVTNLGSFTLTPGDWMVTGLFGWSWPIGVTVAGNSWGISTANNTLTGSIPGSLNGGAYLYVSSQSFGTVLHTPMTPVFIKVPAGSSITYFANALTYFSGGPDTSNAICLITATRIR